MNKRKSVLPPELAVELPVRQTKGKDSYCPFCRKVQGTVCQDLELASECAETNIGKNFIPEAIWPPGHSYAGK